MTEAEMTRLLKRHKDIARHGADAHRLQLIREKRVREQEEWVRRHDLACLVKECRTKLGPWAKGGRTNGRLWVLCKRCAWDKDRKKASA